MLHSCTQAYPPTWAMRRLNTAAKEKLDHRCVLGACANATYKRVRGRSARRLEGVTGPARQVGVRAGYRAANRIDIRTAFALVDLEPMTGIEPAYSAWEVGSTRSARVHSRLPGFKRRGPELPSEL
jgi:hypothetical protein